MTARLELMLDNTLSEIDRIHDAVDRLCDALQEGPPDTAARFDIKLALEEVFTNIVHHACPASEHHSITLVMVAGAAEVVCRLQDKGPPFDPLRHAPPNTDLDAKDREIGGLGIHFARQVMHVMRYERTGPYNILHMTRRLDS